MICHRAIDCFTTGSASQYKAVFLHLSASGHTQFIVIWCLARTTYLIKIFQSFLKKKEKNRFFGSSGFASIALILSSAINLNFCS